MSRTTLYRMFDSTDRLLYVGISCRPFERLSQHRDDKAWWQEISSTKLEHFEDRASALAAELMAIKTENPLYNIVGRNGVAQVDASIETACSTGDHESAEPPVRWWCHIATTDTGFEPVEPITTYPDAEDGGGQWHGRAVADFRQGKVVAVVGDVLMVQLFSFWDGDPTNIQPFRLDDPARWRFYDRWDDWVDAGDRLSGFKPTAIGSRRYAEFMRGPLDMRTGLPKAQRPAARRQPISPGDPS